MRRRWGLVCLQSNKNFTEYKGYCKSYGLEIQRKKRKFMKNSADARSKRTESNGRFMKLSIYDLKKTTAIILLKNI